MDLKVILKELKKGINETLKYIFSHHLPNEYYKCYLVKIRNRNIYICSRCLGIYLGILCGIFIYFLNIFNEFISYFIISIFPLFTLIDWIISTFNIHKSYNFFRTFFGILLGIAYSFGVILFFREFPNYYVISIGLFYILISLFLLFLRPKKKRFKT